MEGILRARDVIMVGSRDGIEASMHLWSDLPYLIDDDIFGKEGIHLMGQCHRIPYFPLYVEMGIVVARMDARIGAATACDGDRLAQLEAQALLDGLLHTVGMRLDLVAMVTAAVVGQMDEISGHILLFEGTKIEKKLMQNYEC